MYILLAKNDDGQWMRIHVFICLFVMPVCSNGIYIKEREEEEVVNKMKLCSGSAHKLFGFYFRNQLSSGLLSVVGFLFSHSNWRERKKGTSGWIVSHCARGYDFLKFSIKLKFMNKCKTHTHILINSSDRIGRQHTFQFSLAMQGKHNLWTFSCEYL